MYNILDKKSLASLKKKEPKRFKLEPKGGSYLDLRGLKLEKVEGFDTKKLTELARILRGLIFAMLEGSQSGHPGGSSSKVEQWLAMVLGGVIAFDPLDPKNRGRDRMVWSAGHCTPLFYSGLTLIYESLKKVGKDFDKEKLHAVLAKDLATFRNPGGPQGHVEDIHPLADTCTGPSGHGLSVAGGMAAVHKSCGLPTKVWVLMGDAESEEGMTYEARNVFNTLGLDNLIVSLDYNHFGIDGKIEEVVSSRYLNHWQGLGWNVIEVDGHNLLELIYAYKKAAAGFSNGTPTVVIAHGIKGKEYGSLENSEKSHGAVAPQKDYLKIMKALGFKVSGNPEISSGQGIKKDLEVVMKSLDKKLAEYVIGRLEVGSGLVEPETELVEVMKKAMGDKPLVNPLEIKRPEKLPPELKFKPGSKVATRKAAGAWYEWLMKQTGFFYAGAGDLSGSVGLSGAEKVYGLITREKPDGRSIRCGIAEQNMGMTLSGLTRDELPGGFRPISAFGTFAVFASMLSNTVRLSVISNHLNPDNKGFFIMIASHDGPETGEDGPTHQGLYWMSMFSAYPGIKVYKPLDAAETVEMLFHALEKGEPIALSVARPGTTVFKRNNADEAVNGAYIFSDYKNNGKDKVVLAVSGPKLMENVLKALPDLRKKLDVKVLAVTSPGLFEELRKENPKKAKQILSDKERSRVIPIHNGWKGFLYPFVLPANYDRKKISVDSYLCSGTDREVYDIAGLDVADLKERILGLVE